MMELTYNRSPGAMMFIWFCVLVGIVLSLILIASEETRRKTVSGRTTFIITKDGIEELEGSLEDFLESWDIQDHLEEIAEEDVA